jgi:hypothetical protein
MMQSFWDWQALVQNLSCALTSGSACLTQLPPDALLFMEAKYGRKTSPQFHRTEVVRLT